MSILNWLDGKQTVQKLFAILGTDGTYVPIHGSLKVNKTLTPAVTAAAYASGNGVGGKLSFTSASRAGLAGGVINSVIITDLSHNQIPYDIWFFDSDPSASTLTDKTNITINSADLVRSIGFASLGGLWEVPTTGGSVTQALLDIPFVLASGVTTLFAVLIARGVPTYGSTTDITIRLVITQEG